MGSSVQDAGRMRDVLCKLGMFLLQQADWKAVFLDIKYVLSESSPDSICTLP